MKSLLFAGMKYLFLLVLVLLIRVQTQAQAHHSGWSGLFYTVKLGKKTDLIGDAQFRSGNDFSHMQSLLLRTGFQYSFRPNLMATAGYAYVMPRRTVEGVTGYGEEHRLWQQLIVTHPLGFASVQHRFRIEQRFHSKSVVMGDKLENEGNVFSNRFRYFVRGIQPLVKQKPFVNGPFVALQNEVMLHYGDKSATNGKVFDQNRLYIAAGHRFSKRFDLEAGYMNQYAVGRGKAFTNNHIAQLALYFRL